ncbi:MAG TPA: hypothetical protein VK808_08135 [Bacteroidia bacterium]|jgi:hypothetical protein|nr:hypothetical protein [Bacteroidia bacterium]
MTDKFRSLSLRQAIAVQIFYASPDDENLLGKTLNSDSWNEPLGIVSAITFRKTGTAKDEALEKLIAAKAYKKILEQYDKPKATFKMVVIYKNDRDEANEMNLTNAIEAALSPLELPKQIMEFLLEKKEYGFLKKGPPSNK